jgi:hypothetical protein
MSMWLRVVIAVTACTIVIAVAALVFVPKVWRGVRAGSTGSAQAARAYLRTMQVHDTAAGYELLCKRVQSSMSRANYETLETRMDVLFGPVVSYHVDFGMSVPGQRNGQAAFRITTPRQTFGGAAVMRREGGHWRWCGVGSQRPFGATRVDPRA